MQSPFADGDLYIGTDCCATIKNPRSATISYTSHGRTCFAWRYASQARSRRRRWPERPGFTGIAPCETIEAKMQPQLGLPLSAVRLDCRANRFLIVALQE